MLNTQHGTGAALITFSSLCGVQQTYDMHCIGKLDRCYCCNSAVEDGWYVLSSKRDCPASGKELFTCTASIATSPCRPTLLQCWARTHYHWHMVTTSTSCLVITHHLTISENNTDNGNGDDPDLCTPSCWGPAPTRRSTFQSCFTGGRYSARLTR